MSRRGSPLQCGCTAAWVSFGCMRPRLSRLHPLWPVPLCPQLPLHPLYCLLLMTTAHTPPLQSCSRMRSSAAQTLICNGPPTKLSLSFQRNFQQRESIDETCKLLKGAMSSHHCTICEAPDALPRAWVTAMFQDADLMWRRHQISPMLWCLVEV